MTEVAEPRTTPRPDPLAGVVGALRRHRWIRWLLSGVSVVLLGASVVMIGYPFYTNLYQSRVQARLESQFASPELRQAYIVDQVEEGDALTRILIPEIEVDTIVVEGTTASALRAGAGHYPQTPLPCEAGNVGIAGHRTTYGRPFHDVDLLQVGSRITLETPIGSCTYEVFNTMIVSPTDTWVVLPLDGEGATLTLTTCHPKHSARQRLIVQARLVGDTAVSGDTA